MTAVDVWAPLGVAGRVPVVDALPANEFDSSPERTPRVHRCVLELGGHRVDVSWEHRVLVASVAGPGGALHELARGKRRSATGPGSFVWSHTTMPVLLGGDEVTVERERSGRDRWLWRVGAAARSWTFRPGGLVFADRMELTRDGERSPVVVHELRPVPGVPRSGGRAPEVSWDGRACLAEVLLPVMWVLERTHEGLLPKAQRVVRADVLG